MIKPPKKIEYLEGVIRRSQPTTFNLIIFINLADMHIDKRGVIYIFFV